MPVVPRATPIVVRSGHLERRRRVTTTGQAGAAQPPASGPGGDERPADPADRSVLVWARSLRRIAFGGLPVG